MNSAVLKTKEWDGFLDIPEGESDKWAVQRFTVSRTQSMMHMMGLDGMHGRHVPAGSYTRLVLNKKVVFMSDTPAERRDHSEFVYQVASSGGKVLIFGLGLGVCIEMIMEKAKIKGAWWKMPERIDVVENSKDVINLVAPHYAKKYPDQFRLIEADALTYMPNGERYDCIWFDIWADMDTDNKPEYMMLAKRWARHGAWKGFWGKDYVYERGRFKRDSRYW